MRCWHRCITPTIALALTLAAGVAPVAWADPPPLDLAEAAIRAENCGLPLSTAWADPPPLAGGAAAAGALTTIATTQLAVIERDEVTPRAPAESTIIARPTRESMGDRSRASFNDERSPK